MPSEEEQNKKEGKGFAGLSSLVSNMDMTPPTTKTEPAASAVSSRHPDPKASQPQPTQQHQTYQLSAQPPSSGWSGSKWLLGIAVIIGVLWLIGQSGKKPTSPAPAYSPQPESQSVTTPRASQPPSRPTEDQPPVGSYLVLNVAQIRYCLAEDIRLKAAKGVVNGYLESEVNRFNAMVDDYNSRCGEFKYQKGALESAKRDVSSFFSELQAEGVSRFSTSGSSGTPSIVNPESGKETTEYLNSESLDSNEKTSLMAVLSANASNCTSDTPCEVGLFSLEPVDVDMDGESEYLVIPEGYCGSAGCGTFLFKKSNSGGWYQIASAFGWVTIGNKQINGYRTLIVEKKIYRSGGGFDIASQEYAWAGNGYKISRNPP